MITRQNYYQILNIPTNSSIKQIKLAFKSQIIKYHPDKNQNLLKKQHFITQNQNIKTNQDKKQQRNTFQQYNKQKSMKIIQAYQFLMDKQKRLKYDQELNLQLLKQKIIENRHKDQISLNSLNKASKNYNQQSDPLIQQKHTKQQYGKFLSQEDINKYYEQSNTQENQSQDQVVILSCQQCFGETQVSQQTLQHAQRKQISINCHHCGIYITLVD